MSIIHKKKSSGSHSVRTGLVVCGSLALSFSGSLFAATWTAEELAVVQMVNLQRGFHDLDPVQMDDRLHEAALGHSQSMAEYNYFSHTTLVGTDPLSPAARIRASGYDLNRFGENIAAGQGRAAPTFTTPSPAIDAAHDVMYGTEDLNEINHFFTSYSDGIPVATGWDTLGLGVSEDAWDAWYHRPDENGDPENSGGWMGSASHRHTILNGLLDDIGVGYVYEANDQAPILLDKGNEFDRPLYTYWTQEFASGDSLEPSPVPVPAAFWLLGSGLLGLIAVGRRKPLNGTEMV
jgi:uncharacterized protein YkwD